MEHIEIYESDLEKIIMESDTFALRQKGLNICESRKNQVKIPGYGIADIVGLRKYGHLMRRGESYLEITVYELKKDRIGVSAFFQAVGYCKGIQRFFESRKFNYPITFKICLIGKELDCSGSLIYLPDLINGSILPIDGESCLSSVEFYKYNYGIDGVEFKKEQGYISYGDKFGKL